MQYERIRESADPGSVANCQDQFERQRSDRSNSPFILVGVWRFCEGLGFHQRLKSLKVEFNIKGRSMLRRLRLGLNLLPDWC